MTLRGTLLLAQAPLLGALAFLGALCLVRVASLGGSAQHVLRDNYRSVLAAQRMKEAIELQGIDRHGDRPGARRRHRGRERARPGMHVVLHAAAFGPQRCWR